uniref:Cytohesin 1 interacting protein n=1 Tax=Ursus maritimus TaxID=29073 RepID=A0A452TGT3_URSMA
MSLQRLTRQSSNGSLVDYWAAPAYSSYSPLTGSFRMDDNRRIQMLADTVATLPRGRKQEMSPLSGDQEVTICYLAAEVATVSNLELLPACGLSG